MTFGRCSEFWFCNFAFLGPSFNKIKVLWPQKLQFSLNQNSKPLPKVKIAVLKEFKINEIVFTKNLGGGKISEISTLWVCVLTWNWLDFVSELKYPCSSYHWLHCLQHCPNTWSNHWKKKIYVYSYLNLNIPICKFANI